MPLESYPLLSVAITAGTSLSETVTLGRANLFAIQTPSAWTAAGITFSVSVDGVNFLDLYDQAGNEFTIPASASKHFGGLDVLAMGSFNYVKLRSGTSASPVNQAAARTLNLILRNAGAY
jgi:hypothetical protein